MELKRADAPTSTVSIRIAMHDLAFDALYAVCPGDRRYALADGVDAVPLSALLPSPH